MNREEIRDLLGAYVLDAVSADERAAIDAALASDPEMAAEADELRTVVAALDVSLAESAEPAPDLWGKISTQLGGSVVAFPQRRRTWPAWTMGAIAAASALVLGLVVANQASEIERLRASDPVVEALAAPGSEVVELTDPDGGAVLMSVVLTADGVGYVTGSSLPEVAPDRTYQLWAITGDRVISAGVLGASPDGSPFRFVGDLDGLAITEEVAGGVVSSENPALAVWLDA